MGGSEKKDTMKEDSEVEAEEAGWREGGVRDEEDQEEAGNDHDKDYGETK